MGGRIVTTPALYDLFEQQAYDAMCDVLVRRFGYTRADLEGHSWLDVEAMLRDEVAE